MLTLQKEFATQSSLSQQSVKKLIKNLCFLSTKAQVEEDIEVWLLTVELENIPLPEVIELINLELQQQKVDFLEKSLAEKEEEIKQKRKR